MVSEHDLAEGRVYPPLSNILQVSIKMATQIGGFAYRENMALVYPEPLDKEQHIRYEYCQQVIRVSGMVACQVW